MDMTRKRIIILIIVIIIAAILGRLSVSDIMNLMISGKMFGENLL